MEYPVVVVLSGPESARAKAEIALEKARLTVIPPNEWPIQRQSYKAEHWPHLTQLPSGQDPDEEHGFVAVLAETEQAFHAAYGVVEKAGWVLRVHYELPSKPEPDPITATLQEMRSLIVAQGREIELLKAGRA